MPIVFTNCTKKKKIAPNHSTSLGNTKFSTQEELFADWIKRLSAATPQAQAEQMYKGRGPKEAQNVALCLQAKLYFISVGLGTVRSTDTIPSYDATLDASSKNGLRNIIDNSLNVSSWWRWISGTSPFSRGSLESIFESTINDDVFIAAPSPYIKMIQSDLGALSDESRNRVYIFSRDLGSLAPSTRQMCVPYDARLDSPDSRYRGTMSDFAQRAMRHFVEVVYRRQRMNREAMLGSVERELQRLKAPEATFRQKMNDKHMKEAINRELMNAETPHSASSMLRHFRDNLLVACEQERFKRLYHEVVYEKTQAGLSQK